MRWLLKGKFKLFREQKGFTLMEILVTAGILSVIADILKRQPKR